MFDYLLYPCIRVGWKPGHGQQLGLAAFAIISAVAQSAEPGPGPGDIILHCENSFVSTPAYLHWAEQ